MSEFERHHESGLLVPTELSKTREAWTGDAFKVLRRLARVAHAHALNIVVVCDKCQKPIEFSVDERDGSAVMECECKRRVVV